MAASSCENKSQSLKCAAMSVVLGEQAQQIGRSNHKETGGESRRKEKPPFATPWGVCTLGTLLWVEGM